MGKPILELREVSCYLEEGTNIFSHVSFGVNEGDILVLQGRSGSGKSTLLKCISHLALHTGECLYRGRTPQAYGIPAYRTRVLYVPQRPALLPGTPKDFLAAISNLKARKDCVEDSVIKRALEVGEAMGVDSELWSRNWISLSGGEGQRIMLAAALSLDSAEIILLDEPTSALDSETSRTVENILVDSVRSANTKLKALIWITHSSDQSTRVGTRFIHLAAGGCYETEDGHLASLSPVSPFK